MQIKMFRLLILSVVMAFAMVLVKAQEPPFFNEIAAFKKQDSLHPAPSGAILFVGSSSFRIWTAMQAAFPEHTILNRGFGGSTLPDVIRYADDIIFPYHPKQIVIYGGDNDLASSDTVTGQVVFERFTRLFALIRSRLKTTPILFVSIKPSPSRIKLMPDMEKANKLIAGFLRRQKQAAFVDVYHPMLASDGKPIADLFQEDELHMNAKGYAIWTKLIAPNLVK